jgi:cytochrome P450
MRMATSAEATADDAAATRAPGPDSWNPFWFFPELRRDPLEFLVRLHRDYGDVVRLGRWPTENYFIYHPTEIRRVLQDNNQNYVKGPIVARTKVLIGEGLFTSEGDFWRRQRRLAQPAFHHRRIAGFVGSMNDAAARMLERWQAFARGGDTFDLAVEMSRVTLALAGRTLFGLDLDAEAAAVGAALREALAYTTYRTTAFVPLPAFVPTARNRRFKTELQNLDRVVYDIIETRRRSGLSGDDLLGLLMDARDADTGQGMSDRQLRDEVMTFLLAGHETTAVTLAWTFYLLAKHPAVDERLRDEVERVLAGREPTANDLAQLTYTRMVVEEAMRLYPPSPAIGRQTIGPDLLGGHPVPGGRPVTIATWVTHRHPEFWDDAERFDPERFAPERVAERPRFAYLPFSGGPRLCIGSEFAVFEAQVILAMVVQRHRVRLAVEHQIEPSLGVTTRPKGGVFVTLAPR